MEARTQKVAILAVSRFLILFHTCQSVPLSNCSLPSSADEAACTTDHARQRIFRFQDHLPPGSDFFPDERAMVPFALVNYRIYGRDLRPPLSQDLLDAAFAGVAEDYQNRLKIGVELYSTVFLPSTNPSIAQKGQAVETGRRSWQVGTRCPFDPSPFQSLDIIFRFSVGVESLFVDYTGNSAMRNMQMRHEMMKELGFEEVYWLPVSAQNPQGETLRMLPYLPIEPTLSQRITLHIEGSCLRPFTSEKETAFLVALAPLLIEAASAALLRIEQVLEEEASQDASALDEVTISIVAAIYEHDHRLTLEQALANTGTGLLAPDVEGGLSPLASALAKVGLPVEAVSVASINQMNGAPPITLYDWVKFGLCPKPPQPEQEEPNRWDGWVAVAVSAGAMILLIFFGVHNFARKKALLTANSASKTSAYPSYRSTNGTVTQEGGGDLSASPLLPPASSLRPAASLQSMLSSSLPIEQHPSLIRYSLGRTSVAKDADDEPDDTIRPEDLELAFDAEGNEVVLGAGSFGKVYKGIYLGTEEVAIKVFSAHEFNETSDLREILVLRKCRSEYVVQFKGVAPVADGLWLVMEFLPGGNLQKALASGTYFRWSGRGKVIALDVAKGMAFLHSNGIIHMDMKSPNILLTGDGRAKIADVGLARTMGSRTHASKVGFGTFDWMAPEVLVYECATYKADVFSFGVILWEIVTGKQPKRSSGSPVNVPEDCCGATEALINRCLAIDYRERPTAKEVVEALQAIIHPERASSLSIADAAPLRPSLPMVPPVSASELRAVLQGKAPPVLNPGWQDAPSGHFNPFSHPPPKLGKVGAREAAERKAAQPPGVGPHGQARGGQSSQAIEQSLRKRSLPPVGVTASQRSYTRSDTL